MMEDLRLCKKCNELKPTNGFRGRIRGRICKDCRKKAQAADFRRRYHSDVEKEKRANLTIKRKQAKAEVIKFCKDCGQPLPREWLKERCSDCHRKMRTGLSRKWRANNLEKVKAYQKAWWQRYYHKNRLKLLAYYAERDEKRGRHISLNYVKFDKHGHPLSLIERIGGSDPCKVLDDQMLIEAALSRLTEIQKQIVLSYAENELSLQVTAAELEISEENLRQALEEIWEILAS